MVENFTSHEVGIDEIMRTRCGAAYDYWDGLRHGRFAPAWGEFKLIDLPPAVIPDMRVVDVVDDGRDFAYRFWGTGLSTVRKLDRTGMCLSEIDAQRRASAMDEYRKVLETRACIAYVCNVRPGEDRPSLHAPAIRMPLSSDGKTVDKIVSLTDFTADEREWQRYYEGLGSPQGTNR